MSGIDRPWQRIIRKIFLKFSCVTTGLHAAQCRFQYEKLRFFNMRRVGIFFFNERHCLQTSFLVLSTSQVVYIRLKKVRFIASLFTSWSKERRTIGACNRCKVKRVKIIFFVRYYLSVFVYTTGTFRYSDMIKTSQIIKGWAITTLCPAQDYVIHIFRNILCLFVAGFSLDCNHRLAFHFPRFTIRNRHD